MEADFSGYATKAGIKCSDGRTIMPDAFKHNDGGRVPLVWQHGHSDPGNVLGYALLENRSDGVYAYGFFNETEAGKSARTLVQHGDIVALSIYANKLVEKSKSVIHGAIREVSLVLSGANPGALIDNVNLAHSDGEIETLEDEAIIYTGLTLEHQEKTMPDSSSGESGKTIEDVYSAFTEEQKNVVHYMIGAAIEASTPAETAHSDDLGAEHEKIYHALSAEQKDAANYVVARDTQTSIIPDDETEGDLNHKEGTEMARNIFEQNDAPAGTAQTHLSHDQLSEIVADAKKYGSFKDAFLAHMTTYGIENIDFLFPDAQKLLNSPEMVLRRQEWVSAVIAGVKKSPFSRIKTVSADLTLDEARAKGYVKGSMKKEEWFALQKRVTTPTTIYKKNKLDRDDIIDITDLDVVAWLKAEMRIMLDEEIARAILVGDAREIDDDDKVDETSIRPIAYDDDFYAHKTIIPANVVGDSIVEAILRSRPNYRGTGSPTMYCTEGLLTDLLLVKDKMGRRLYATQDELAFALRVSRIEIVPVMESRTTNGGDLIAILVNLTDYTMGADKGGQVSMFDDFDIDYNQFKYLMETRMSGALTLFKSALVITRAEGVQVIPSVPTFNANTGVVTIPATVGVGYAQDGTVRSAGTQAAIPLGESTEVVATPLTNYYFPHNFDADWTFTRNAE